MCSNEWSAIEYSKVPSKAMSDLMKAFSKHDKERFGAYLTSLEKGETKINACAVYPYDIVKNMQTGNARGADAQWNALPNYMEGNEEKVIPLVDVSGSMQTPAGGNPAITCMNVAISLGLYISERNVGPFKDAFLTFSESPTLEVTKGSLSERYRQMRDSKWGGSTNLQKAFEALLDKAVKGNVPSSEMPTMMIILSDMEFNQAVGSGYRGAPTWSDTAQEMIEKMYTAAGYRVPKIVYWNLQSRGDKNKPVKFDKNGTALVSGFSPALLTSLLAGKDIALDGVVRRESDVSTTIQSDVLVTEIQIRFTTY
jgi:hypothetical protein